MADYLRTVLFLCLARLATCTYTCKVFHVPVHEPSAPALAPNFGPFNNTYETVHFLNEITSRVFNASLLSGATTVNLDASIWVEYCRPLGSAHLNTVQVLTHGIGFDHSYWEFGSANSQYNYIKAATDAGYSVLNYDRLGMGNSTRGNPYTTQQLGPEVEVLATLTRYLKNGELSKYSGCAIPIPKTIAHVGHSFGSTITESFASKYPSLTDGIVLSGWSTNGSFALDFAISGNFHIAAESVSRLSTYDKGYLTWGDELSNQYSFLAWPYFDPAVLKQAEGTKMPFTIAEFLTAGPSTPSTYPGSVMVIAGEFDRIFCGAQCRGIIESSASFFKQAKLLTTYIQPKAGHGLNLQYNATGTYKVISNFIGKHISM